MTNEDPQDRVRAFVDAWSIQWPGGMDVQNLPGLRLTDTDLRDTVSELEARQREPRIEILVVRDPDDGNDVMVYVDGELRIVTLETVDPGAGYSLSDWEAGTDALAQRTDYSPDFAQAVIDAREEAVENYPQYITEEE